MAPPSRVNDRHTLTRGIFQAIFIAAIMFTSLAGYLFVLKWRGAAGAERCTKIPADDWFPFWPSWVWLYLLPYAVAPILIGMLSRGTFWWYVRSGLVIVAVTLVIFVIFPTQTDPSHRTEDVGDGFTAAMYKNMIEIDDPPANAAPSLHVSLTCLLLLALLKDFPRWWPAWFGFIGLVWLSTLVTRQHHLIDVATGIALALVVAYVASRSVFGTIRT